MSKPDRSKYSKLSSFFLLFQGYLRATKAIFVRVNSTLYIKDLWDPCFIQTPNILRGLFQRILLHAPGHHLTLTTVHAQKAHATCITVTTTPRKCNREPRLIREATNRDSVQTLLTLSSGPARVPFSSYLRDVQALILPRTQVDLPTVNMPLVVVLNLSEGCGIRMRSVSYMKRLDHVCAFA